MPDRFLILVGVAASSSSLSELSNRRLIGALVSSSESEEIRRFLLSATVKTDGLEIYNLPQSKLATKNM